MTVISLQMLTSQKRTAPDDDGQRARMAPDDDGYFFANAYVTEVAGYAPPFSD